MEKRKLVHAQILISKHPESGPLGLGMDEVVKHWRSGLVDGEIREPMQTLFLCEHSFCELLSVLGQMRQARQ